MSLAQQQIFHEIYSMHAVRMRKGVHEDELLARWDRRKALARRRLKPGVRKLLVDVAVMLMSGDELSTPFQMEGPIRALAREFLCLWGWEWLAADAAAEEVTEAALAKLKAKRPSWDEGQPNYSSTIRLSQERSRCRNCGERLPEGRPVFCCKKCADVFYAHIWREFRGGQEQTQKERAARYAIADALSGQLGRGKV